MPEAELDRFMFSVNVGYPSEEEELEVVERTTMGDEPPPLEPVLQRERLLAFQNLVRRLPTSKDVHSYGVRLARATRPGPDAPDFVNELLHWEQDLGPVNIWLWVHESGSITQEQVPSIEDVQAVFPAVLSHRIVLEFSKRKRRVFARKMSFDDCFRR